MSKSEISPALSPGIRDAGASGGVLAPPAAPLAMDATRAGTEVALSKKPARIHALDFTKGALVLIMVLYHWLNYFVTANGNVYKYLRFLTPSFIFISGFLISHVYLSKYQASGLKVPRRLLVRGIKLLAIVLCLNVALSLLHVQAVETRASSLSRGHMVSAYLIGTASVSFSVLIPIAYLLILGAGLLIVSRYYRNIFHVTCAMLIAGAFLLEWKGVGGGYLQIFSIGMLGISVGYIPIERISSFLKHHLTILMAYLAYLAGITLWNDVYPLQIVGVCLSLAIIYLIGSGDPDASLRKVVILLGQYSLFAYIGQIVILQILRRGLRPLGGGMGVSGAAFLACAAGTILSVEVLDRARVRMSGVNRVYTAVFC